MINCEMYAVSANTFKGGKTVSFFSGFFTIPCNCKKLLYAPCMIWKVVIHLFLGTCDWVRALLKGDVKKFISNSCTIAKGKEI